MSEKSANESVETLLDLVREKASQQVERVQVHTTDLEQRIHARASDILQAIQAPPDLSTMVDLLEAQIDRVSHQVQLQDVGTVQHIGSGVATLSGLPGASTDELVDFPTGVQGLILNLDHARLDVVLLGSDEGIQGGDLVTATGQRIRVPVGRQLLGRVVNALGQPLDDGGPIQATDHHYLAREAPDIVDRAPVEEPLHTGLKVVDALFPIGRGQRELILGNRKIGKTTAAVDAILNQQGSGVPCVYVAIGQKKSSTLAIIETLRRRGAMRYTTVVIASPEDPPALRYLAPYAGCTIAEFLMDEGQDALIVYDDLSKHADAYRELSLLLRRPPGREAYPGDIFYLHARLLERACKLKDDRGGGSLTALPIVETKQGNLSAYIPTNLISICDGQIMLDSDLFNSGVKPAVDIGRSVSRVGGKAQSPAMQAVAGELRLEISQYEEVARFARFGTEVEETTKQQIRHGERLRRALTQPAHRPLSLDAQIVILLAVQEGHLDAVPVDDLTAFERRLLQHVREQQPQLLQRISRTGELDDDARETLTQAIAEHSIDWTEGRTSR